MNRTPTFRKQELVLNIEQQGCIESLDVLFSLWSKTFIIIACEIGFHGPDCVLPCGYPSFGKNCQSMCSCAKEFCDFVDGCKDVKGIYFLYRM